MYFLLIYYKLKTNFIAKSQLLYMECPLTRERKQKKNPIYIFKSVRVRLQESVRLRECVNTAEHRFNEVPRDWATWFVISRVRYIESLDMTNLLENNQSVRYIGV